MEVFINDRQYLALRLSGSGESVGVFMYSRGQGMVPKVLDAWQMKSIYGEQ